MSNTTQTTQADQAALQGKRIAVIGYGSQGRGQSLNLRDSGMDVVLGLRPNGKTWNQAVEDGWTPSPIAEAVASADLICLLCPDMQQPKVYNELVAPNLKDGAAILFSHGFNVLYGSIKVAEGHDVIMVAPKGPGAIVRREYENGFGVPCLIAVAQDASGEAEKKCLAYNDN